jgi:hypothetical protein
VNRKPESHAGSPSREEYIELPEQKLLPTLSDTLTFNHRGHSKRIKQEPQGKLKYQLYSSFSDRVEVEETPFTHRLELINNQLERSIIRKNLGRASSKSRAVPLRWSIDADPSTYILTKTATYAAGRYPRRSAF